MGATPGLGIPPLAGMATYAGAGRPGYSVEENVALMRRYNYVKSRLVQLSAAFMNPTPEWEVKCALSLHLYLDAEHSQALRKRVGELRSPPPPLDEAPDPALQALLDEALRAQNTIELLAGLFRVLRPALRAAYRQHLAETNPVFDYPTCRLLRIAIEDEQQMIDWGVQALEALTPDEAGQGIAADWERHLRAYLQAAGSLTGTEETQSSVELPAPRARGEFVPDVDPRRDWRSGEIYNFHYRAGDVYRDETADEEERVLALMFKRLHEMDVPEMMAGILLQTPGKPWDYYHDMARQLWDEARHAMMGEVWFATHGVDWSRYPNHVGWALRLNLDLTPLERHIVLFGIEQNLMDRARGKRFEWTIARQANDPLAVYLQDYDWADEVLHAQIGRRWLKPDAGEVKTILEKAQEIAARPSPTLQTRAAMTPQVDWWPRFVKEALGKDNASSAGAQDPRSPTFQASSSG